MDLLLITLGSLQNKASPVSYLDPPLSDTGMKQVCLTSNWLSYNFMSRGWHGLTSPHLASLQTASVISTVTGAPFAVDANLMDFRWIEKKEGALQIPNRALPYENLHWSPKKWLTDQITVAEESAGDFVDRCSFLLDNLEESEYNQYFLVTHKIMTVVLSELLTGLKPKEVKRKLTNFMMDKPVGGSELDTLMNTANKHIFSAHKDCGLTLILSGKPLWFSKIVYEE